MKDRHFPANATPRELISISSCVTNSFIVQLNSPSFACRNLKHGEELVHDHYIKVV